MDIDMNVPHEYVTAVDHVSVAVPDLDEALAYYRDCYGMVALHIETNEEQGVKEAMVGLPNQGPDAAVIQVLAPLSEDSTIGKFLAKNGPGLQQLCLRTNNIDALSEHLKAQGKRLLYPEPKNGTAGARINFVHPKDAGGVLLELTQPAS